MSKKKSSYNKELEGLHFSILQDWVDKGRTEKLPEGMDRYLEQIDYANRLWRSANSPQTIIKKLATTYKELNIMTAKSRYEDAMVWFYLDDKISQEAWRNVIFEKQMQIVDAAIRSATCVDDYNKASMILQRAYKAKGLHELEEEKIPEGAFNRPIKVYSLDTSDFIDLPQNTNRNLLGQYIDEMNLTEQQRVKIKRDAGIAPKELFENGQKEDHR